MTSTKITNHYGVFVNPNVPVTGVMGRTYSLYEAIHESDTVDLSWEDHELECDTLNSLGYCDHEIEMGTLLVGAWMLNESGEYEVDHSSTKHDYAAIIGDQYTQIVWSRYTTRAALCSPCYAGQCDLDSEGIYLGYTLPPSMLAMDSDVPNALVITHDLGFGL